jgi:hypothetical protein
LQAGKTHTDTVTDLEPRIERDPRLPFSTFIDRFLECLSQGATGSNPVPPTTKSAHEPDSPQLSRRGTLCRAGGYTSDVEEDRPGSSPRILTYPGHCRSVARCGGRNPNLPQMAGRWVLLGPSAEWGFSVVLARFRFLVAESVRWWASVPGTVWLGSRRARRCLTEGTS